MEIEWYNPDAGAPLISIASYGITFSSGAVETLGKPKYIKIGLDPEKKQIIIKPSAEESDETIEFIKRERNGNVRITSKDFIRFIKSRMPGEEVIKDKAQKYIAEWNRKKEVLVVNLDDPINT